MELRVPTGDEACPHCWHGLDLATAKRLRYEICEAVDALDALMDFRKWSSDNAEVSEPGGPVASASANCIAPPGFAAPIGSSIRPTITENKSE